MNIYEGFRAQVADAGLELHSPLSVMTSNPSKPVVPRHSN